MAPTKLFVLFLSLLTSATALATPHIAHSAHHRALAGRIPVPVPVDLPALPIHKRRLAKRCKRPSPAAVQPTPHSHTSDPALVATHDSKPTTQHKPPPTTSHYQAPPAKPTPHDSDNNSGGGKTGTGDGTWYGTGLGACGITNSDTDYIAAVSHILFDGFPGYNGANPNHNPICGKKITATYQGKSVTVTVTDRCVGCAPDDLDFSPTAFKQLADLGAGRLFGVKWTMH